MTRQQWLKIAIEQLRIKNIPDPKLSAELILTYFLGIERLQLTLDPLKIIASQDLEPLNNLLSRRSKEEPIAYIIGKKEFFSYEFIVRADTLIPRPETELLIEYALEHVPNTNIRFVDLGTGSGCIATVLCAQKPKWKGFAVDISYNALQVAKKNFHQHNVSKQIQPLQADFTTTFFSQGSLDLCISNPPYISTEEYQQLPTTIKNYEPTIALTPNAHHKNINKVSGLENYKSIIKNALRYLKPKGILIIEHGSTQQKEIIQLFENGMWSKVVGCRDLSNKDRYIVAHKK